MDRFATFSFATALTVAACGGIADGTKVDPEGTKSDGGTVATPDGGFAGDGGGVMPMYGGGRFEDAGIRDSGRKADASKLDSGFPEDDGGSVALYGLPWPEDAGFDGNVQPAYGLPPFDASVPDVD